MSQGLLLLASTEFMIATLVTAAPAVSTAKPNIVCVQDAVARLSSSTFLHSTGLDCQAVPD